MESTALFANVALILAKDLLLNDDKTSESVQPPVHQFMFDENDDEAETFFLYQQRKRMKYGSSMKPEKRNSINFLSQFDCQSFEKLLHMSKPAFLKLFGSVRDYLTKANLPRSVTQQTAFSISLWKMCRDEHFEEIARRFHIPLNDCQKAIREFWKLISHNEAQFIKLPSSKGDVNIKFSAPIGIIALKKLDIFLESNDQEVQIVWQIVCNTERKILDCYVESMHDYDFDTSPIAKMNQRQDAQENHQTYLIGDENFPLKTYLINPFETPNSEEEKQFNEACKKYLTIAQNTFDCLAKQFNMLYALESKDLFEIRQIISCICCLHNICVDINDDYLKRQRDERVKSVNWSKSVHLKNNYPPASQEALQRRNDLIKEIINLEVKL